MFLSLFIFAFYIFANAIPTHGFEIFWNVPSKACHDGGHKLDPRMYGVRMNQQMTNYGVEIVTFYEQFLGIYPSININLDKKTGVTTYSLINGGIPQNVDLKAHLRKASNDIKTAIPNPNYEGLAVIDYESWRPLYHLNWYTRNIYREESKRHVKKLFPHISNKAITLTAERLFNKAAKRFMTATIRLLRRLRPYAKVGFFDYPICNYDAGENGEDECVIDFDDHNYNLAWMYKECNAMFPPVYLYSLTPDFALRQRYIYAKVVMTRRVLFKMGVDLPIYVYTKFEYNTYPGKFEQMDNMYTKSDLCNTLHYAADLGARGAVLWSTSHEMESRCKLITSYVKDTLGPFIKKMLSTQNRCSMTLCHSRGECILNDMSKPINCEQKRNLTQYTCDCIDGWMGERCEYSSYSIPTIELVTIPPEE